MGSQESRDVVLSPLVIPFLLLEGLANLTLVFIGALDISDQALSLFISCKDWRVLELLQGLIDNGHTFLQVIGILIGNPQPLDMMAPINLELHIFGVLAVLDVKAHLEVLPQLKPIVESDICKHTLMFGQSELQHNISVLAVLNTTEIDNSFCLVRTDDLLEFGVGVRLDSQLGQVCQGSQRVAQEVHEDSAHHRAVGDVAVAADTLFGDSGQQDGVELVAVTEDVDIRVQAVLANIVLESLQVAFRWVDIRFTISQQQHEGVSVRTKLMLSQIEANPEPIPDIG
jgi:hypothetical protein